MRKTTNVVPLRRAPGPELSAGDPQISKSIAASKGWLQELNWRANLILDGGDDPEHKLAQAMGALSHHLHKLQEARRS